MSTRTVFFSDWNDVGQSCPDMDSPVLFVVPGTGQVLRGRPQHYGYDNAEQMALVHNKPPLEWLWESVDHEFLDKGIRWWMPCPPIPEA